MTELLPKMSFYEHLKNLRKNLLLSSIFFLILFSVCFYFSEEIFDWLTLPLLRALTPEEVKTHRFIYTTLPEAFFTHVKLALFGACVIGLPFFMHQLWRFIAPGLYMREKKEILPFLIMSPVLFYAGIALSYFLLMPLAWKFFLSFEVPRSSFLPVVLEARIEDYVDLVISLSLAFGLCFQIPIALLLFSKLGIIKAQMLKSKRRYAILLIFILAAFLTPPDIMSQIALALPLLALYEVTIYLMQNQEKKDT